MEASETPAAQQAKTKEVLVKTPRPGQCHQPGKGDYQVIHQGQHQGSFGQEDPPCRGQRHQEHQEYQDYQEHQVSAILHPGAVALHPGAAVPTQDQQYSTQEQQSSASEQQSMTTPSAEGNTIMKFSPVEAPAPKKPSPVEALAPKEE